MVADYSVVFDRLPKHPVYSSSPHNKHDRLLDLQLYLKFRMEQLNIKMRSNMLKYKLYNN